MRPVRIYLVVIQLEQHGRFEKHLGVNTLNGLDTEGKGKA